MIDVYFWPTGNGKKITIMLEEVGLPYRIVPVNINKGDQNTPEYDAINMHPYEEVVRVMQEIEPPAHTATAMDDPAAKL